MTNVVLQASNVLWATSVLGVLAKLSPDAQWSANDREKLGRLLDVLANRILASWASCPASSVDRPQQPTASPLTSQVCPLLLACLSVPVLLSQDDTYSLPFMSPTTP